MSFEVYVPKQKEIFGAYMMAKRQLRYGELRSCVSTSDKGTFGELQFGDESRDSES